MKVLDAKKNKKHGNKNQHPNQTWQQFAVLS